MFGQISYPSHRISKVADYLQLDICGLTVEEVLNKWLKFNTEIPVVLHGDWTKKGFSENNIVKSDRQQEYLDIIELMQSKTKVLGFTIHPPTRKTASIEVFKSIIDRLQVESKTPFYIENRSNQRLLVSTPLEIIELSKTRYMTLDIPQLYIGCKYDKDIFMNTLTQLNLENIKEVHLANIVKTSKNTFVGRQLDDGLLDCKKIFKDIIHEEKLITLEVLGGIPTFDKQVAYLE